MCLTDVILVSCQDISTPRRRVLLDPEDEGSKLLQNVSNYLPAGTVISHHTLSSIVSDIIPPIT